MTSPYLDRTRSMAEARSDLRSKRYELLIAQNAAREAGNIGTKRAIDREIDAIDARLKVLEGWL